MTVASIQNLLDAVSSTVVTDRGPQAEIAEVLGVSEPFVSKCVKRGWFPIDRARTLADKYNVPFIDLVKPRLRDFINQ
ncbi:MAG: helix-turn-helix domain-containing protein [Casimicrobium sp.]